MEKALDSGGAAIVRAQVLDVYKIPPVNKKSSSMGDLERVIWFGSGVLAASIAIIGGAWAIKQLAPTPSSP